MEIFADRIKQLRTEKDTTGEDIEKATGITKGMISKYESEVRTAPHI